MGVLFRKNEACRHSDSVLFFLGAWFYRNDLDNTVSAARHEVLRELQGAEVNAKVTVVYASICSQF